MIVEFVGGARDGETLDVPREKLMMEAGRYIYRVPLFYSAFVERDPSTIAHPRVGEYVLSGGFLLYRGERW